jgi:DNA adenine methylase
LGESSGFSKQASQSNFSYNNIRKLEGYNKIIQKWDITNLDYTDILPACKKESFVFLDPPYDINSFLYGKGGNMHNNFDHDEFRDAASLCEGQTMITYNSNDKLKEMFSSWNQLDWDLTYTMHSSKIYRKDESNRRELLLTNYGYPKENTLEEFYDTNANATPADESPKRDLEFNQ